MSARAPILAAALLLSTAVPGEGQRWTLPAGLQERVDAVFDFVERDAPGCALGVVREGALVYGRGYGLANLDWGIPIGTSTVFDIGSVSKQFTATAVALLDMDGVLSLDDDVRRWVPELPDYGRTLTLRHLLNHTSGMRDYLTLESIAGTDFDNVYDELDGVRMITRQQGLNFPPGNEYLYSNSGYLLLANIVRRATGASLRRFLEARVFDPLGMAGTSVWDDNGEVLAERATGYQRGDAGWRISHAWNFQMGGDGQVITSIEDLARWDANFYDPVVGGAGLVDRLHTRGVLTGGDTIPYALGLVVDEYRGARRVHHGGSWAGFRAQLTRFPDQKTSVIVLCNRADASPGAYATAVADVVLADRFPEAVAEEGAGREVAPDGVDLTAEQLRPWAGLYRHDGRPEYVEVDLDGGALFVEMRGRRFRLLPRSAEEFEAEGVGTVLTFITGGSRVRVGSTELGRVERGRWEGLQELAGTYHSAELETDFEVTVVDGRLHYRRPGEEGTALKRGAGDEFYGPSASLAFERAGGRGLAFRLYAGRVTDLRFERAGG
ncbi:MAG TPA: serine hydrolase domain-containing protein [Longimicrobiales bacterium]|nr:serine hydrolase domain-containing protein [Longimicrobiales bacterium]